jgi:hypothetical protein
MTAQMKRLEEVMRWLDQIERLPQGHPDRLRFLTLAEEALCASTREAQASDLETIEEASR